jgi:hypothetical protein
MGHQEHRCPLDALDGFRDAVGLGRQRVVGALGSARTSDRQRLDDNGSIAQTGELSEEMPKAEGTAEEARDQYDRLTTADADDVQRLAGSHEYVD